MNKSELRQEKKYCHNEVCYSTESVTILEVGQVLNLCPLVFNEYPENLFNLPSEDLGTKTEETSQLISPLPLHRELLENKIHSVSDYEEPTDRHANIYLNQVTIMEELFKMRREIESFRIEVSHAFSAMDFKKIKKNRTLNNRCTFVNRRGENCRGYICKVPGSQLCYAHHVLSNSHHNKEKRNKLY